MAYLELFLLKFSSRRSNREIENIVRTYPRVDFHINPIMTEAEKQEAEAAEQYWIDKLTDYGEPDPWERVHGEMYTMFDD